MNNDSALVPNRPVFINVRRLAMFLGLLLTGVMATSAYAHKVNVFAYAEGDQVYIQGYFSDGTKAKNSDVSVYGSDGRVLLSGKTNEAGEFTFPTQGKGQGLRIVLNAGLGHQASYEIPSDELTDASGMAASGVTDSPDDQTTGNNHNTVATSQLSEVQLRRAVAEAVLPLAREISALKERRGFSDIVGGIGFIVGILGVFAFIKARSETRRAKKEPPDAE